MNKFSLSKFLFYEKQMKSSVFIFAKNCNIRNIRFQIIVEICKHVLKLISVNEEKIFIDSIQS